MSFSVARLTSKDKQGLCQRDQRQQTSQAQPAHLNVQPRTKQHHHPIQTTTPGYFSFDPVVLKVPVLSSSLNLWVMQFQLLAPLYDTLQH